MKITIKRTFAVLMAGGLLASSGAWAQTTKHPTDDKMFQVGGLLGVALPTADEASAQLMFGANASYRLVENIRGGVFVQTSGSTSGNDALEISSRATFFGVEGDFNLANFAVSGAYVGAKLGLVRVSTTSKANGVEQPGSDAQVHMTFGPKLGYDFPLSQNLTIGGEANWMFITADNLTSYLNVLGALKFWF